MLYRFWLNFFLYFVLLSTNGQTETDNILDRLSILSDFFALSVALRSKLVLYCKTEGVKLKVAHKSNV